MMEPSDISDGLVAAAVAGDRRALDAVLAVVRPFAVRYCRARLGRDDLAEEVCRGVLAGLPGYRVQPLPFLAFVHEVAAAWVARDHRAPEGPAARLHTLPAAEREVLVLRVALGLPVEATAEVLGSTVAAVRLAQHRALTWLRGELPSGGDRPLDAAAQEGAAAVVVGVGLAGGGGVETAGR